ncbi:methyltransferase [uncultured Desulfuromonas sp.]|uniref:methyltransferase n=1 Tax=uncultured Desulfuromonas sp. TaxID=181013 RepID=UPI002AAC19B5|nr:methyltransferase [uncultured Desulfuromonas sp.]
MSQISVPQGQWDLSRYPARIDDPLRAWDAADEFILNELHDQNLPHPSQRLLIVNDSFGALSCCLHSYAPTLVSDSCLTYQGLLNNLKSNRIAQDCITFFDSLTTPPGHYDIVLIKVPKSLALLEDQLIRLRPVIKPESVVIGAAMVKHLSATAIELFEKILGPTHTSLARKKARLIFSCFDTERTFTPLPPANLSLPEFQLDLVQHPGVFSMNKLDLGSRLVLEQRHLLPQAETIIDLGCGNGVLGIAAARQQPDAQLIFVDESYRAIDSARINFETIFGPRAARFEVIDCLKGMDRDSVDLIINNPPFHQQQVVGDQVAWQMFRQARQVLKRSGQLWVVGNRHLGYHTKLKRLFGNCKLVASTHKFVLLTATKS